jgi:hypothetical protein
MEINIYSLGGNNAEAATGALFPLPALPAFSYVRLCLHNTVAKSMIQIISQLSLDKNGTSAEKP